MKLLISILILLTLYSCNESKNTPIQQKRKITKEKAKNNSNSLLWKVEGNGIKKPSYIFGSLQVINSGKLNIINKLEATLDKCNSILLETADEPKKENVMAKLTFKNDSISNYLTPGEIKEISSFFNDKMGINEEGFNAFFSKSKPYLIYSTIALASYDKTPQIQLMEFQKYATENNKKLIGLSSLSNTVSLFDSIPNDTLYKWCLTSIRHFEKSKEVVNRLEDIYLKQQLSQIYPLIEENSPEFLEYFDLFVTNRLNKWIHTVEKEIKKGGTFIGIGTLLISCENNLLERLENKGYTVTPIEF